MFAECLENWHTCASTITIASIFSFSRLLYSVIFLSVFLSLWPSLKSKYAHVKERMHQFPNTEHSTWIQTVVATNTYNGRELHEMDTVLGHPRLDGQCCE